MRESVKPTVASYVRYSPRLVWLCAFLLCGYFLPSAANAQTTNATLSGTVYDQKEAQIPGVTVIVTNPATGLERQVETNESGSFTVALLPPGTYLLTVQREGFSTVKIPDITLNVNDQRSLRVELKVGEVGETVTVTAEASLINESPAQTTTIDRTFVGNLPLNGRSFQSLILLSPGVVQAPSNPAGGSSGQFSVNGQRTNANYFTVDGVSANVESNIGNTANLLGQSASGSTPNLSALGTTSTLVSVDALEEFKIQTSTYSAELGRQPGGQVQLVTRSGGSDFHGSIFDYVRNEAFDANNFFNNANGFEKPPLRQNQFGGTFSGPVFLPRFGEGTPAIYNGKKRTFFFFSYEGLRLRLPTSTFLNVPSLRLRQIAAPGIREVLNAYPVPTGPEIPRVVGGVTVPSGAAPFRATYSDPSSTDSYSIRLDHNITGSMTLFGRYNEAPSSSTTRLLSTIQSARGLTRSVTLGTTLVGKSFANDLKFNYTVNQGKFNLEADTFGGAVPVNPSVLVSGYSGGGISAGQVSLNYLPCCVRQYYLGSLQDSFNRQINIVDNVSVVKGNHQLKFGFDYRRLMPTFQPTPFQQNAFFQTEAQVVSGIPVRTFLFSQKGARPRFNNYSAYVQDSWKVNKRLTLDLGLRYELNPAPYDADGVEPIVIRGIVGTDVTGATLAPAGTPFYKTYKTAFAPRLGAAYLLNDKSGRETVLRGGFGVYYDLAGGQALSGFNTFPFTTSINIFDAPFPLPPAQAQIPTFPTVTLPILSNVNVIDPDLKLPYTLQWNFGVEQSLGKDQAISVSYVASAGRRLTTTFLLNTRPNNLGAFPNPNFRNINYATNGPTSDYNSLQTQFRRRLSQGLQLLVNYTWSHAIDMASDEANIGLFDRGNASFDVRHNFSAAVTYELPKFSKNRLVNALAHGWAVDSTIYLQSGQPIPVVVFGATQTSEEGAQVSIRPDLVAGVPVWIDAQGVPGGRRLNPAAFTTPPRVTGTTCSNCFARQGTLGRNAIYGPSIYQVNLGLRREFGLTERLRLQLKGEAFNLFNRPQFTNFQANVGNPSFGIASSTLNNSLGGLNALYQLGGPRSLQFSAKILF